MAGTEKRDISIRGAALLMLGIAGMLVVATVVVRLLFWQFGVREQAAQPPPLSQVSTEADRLPQEPRLQAAPSRDLLALRAEEQALLTSYGWVDRGAGTVRLPIERAIELVAARGLPARAARSAQDPR